MVCSCRYRGSYIKQEKEKKKEMRKKGKGEEKKWNRSLEEREIIRERNKKERERS